jgi:protein TonB
VLRHRFLISFLSTIGFYLVLGFFFFHFSTITVGTETKPEEQIISFSLSAYEPEVIPPVEEIVEEIIEPEPEPLEEVIPEEPIVEEPLIEEPIIQEVIPEPIVEKTVPKPIPVLKKPSIKKPKKKKIKKKKLKKKKIKKRVKKKIKTKRKKAKSKHRVAKKSTKKQASPAKKSAFYAKIRAKIKRNKTYPRIAQRRGMQGSVKVKFTILPNGQVGNIQVSGKKVFYKSARAAIKNAFPIATKNIPVLLPATVNLTLRYQLR